METPYQGNTDFFFKKTKLLKKKKKKKKKKNKTQARTNRRAGVLGHLAGIVIRGLRSTNATDHYCCFLFGGGG
jgi:hypothetical protein